MPRPSRTASMRLPKRRANGRRKGQSRRQPAVVVGVVEVEVVVGVVGVVEVVVEVVAVG